MNVLTKKYKLLALCISKVFDDGNREFIETLNKEMIPHGWRLIVFNTCSDLYWNSPSDNGEESIFSLIDYNYIDALAIHYERINNERIRRNLVDNAVKHGKPVFIINGHYPGCINVNFDSYNGFKNVVLHVLEDHGLTDLHFMAGIRNNSVSDERMSILRDVLASKGIGFKSDMVSYGDFWSVPAKEATEKLLERSKLPQAIICANDTMAISVCSTLKCHGVRVPEDICVTGFDGIAETQLSQPKITTCACKYSDMGRLIAGCLVKNDFNASDRLVPTTLISAESCGCHSIDNSIAVDLMLKTNNCFYRYREEERSLNEMSSKIQHSANIKTASAEIKRHIIYDCAIMLNEDCINPSINPQHINPQPYTEKLCQFFCENDDEPQNPRLVDKDYFYNKLAALLDLKYPIIFSPLNFLDIPLGFIYFHFFDYNIENYCKIPQTVGALNTAISGYRNNQYQRYLTSKFEHMYQTDVMTGLYNRVGCMKEFTILSDSLRLLNGSITFVMADMNKLKYINDTFGHNEGDSAICAVADCIVSALPDNAVCGRIGGDEFIAFFGTQCDNSAIAEKIKESMANYNRTSGKPYEISASIGVISKVVDNTCDMEDFVSESDKLMYIEKNKTHSNRP